MPENYLKLLSNKEYLEYSIARLEEKKEELKELLKNEKNTYKRKPIKQEIRKINKDIRMLKQNLNSDSETQEQANRRKEPVRDGCLKHPYKLWRVVKVALGIPVLGKSFVRDLSPLRVILTDWDRIPRRLVPVLGAGAMVSQIPPAGFMANLNWRNTNRSAKSVNFIHF